MYLPARGRRAHVARGGNVVPVAPGQETKRSKEGTGTALNEGRALGVRNSPRRPADGPNMQVESRMSSIALRLCGCVWFRVALRLARGGVRVVGPWPPTPSTVTDG